MPFMINLVKQIEVVSSAAKANSSINKKFKVVLGQLYLLGKFSKEIVNLIRDTDLRLTMDFHDGCLMIGEVIVA